MADFIIEKNNFNIEKINSQIEDFGRDTGAANFQISNVKAVIEEFLSNILFPNFDGKTELSIVKDERGIVISFCYEGDDYMQKITDNSFLSLKILKSKTKDIKTSKNGSRLTVEFFI